MMFAGWGEFLMMFACVGGFRVGVFCGCLVLTGLILAFGMDSWVFRFCVGLV